MPYGTSLVNEFSPRDRLQFMLLRTYNSFILLAAEYILRILRL